MAAVCIRCGSKEHTTREHDEQKAGGKAAVSDKPKRLASTKPAAEKTPSKSSRVQHPKCWDNCLRPNGIPDIIDKPLRERFYHDPPQESWFHRSACSCVECEKKAIRKRTETMRRLGKA